MLGAQSRKLIEDAYACVTEPDRWQPFLASMASELGACALIETVDRVSGIHSVFCSSGLPQTNELKYVEEYARLSPRLSHGLGQDLGAIGFDYQILDEREMNRNPFYAEFLPQLGFRYFISGVLHQDDTRFSAFSVQRSATQGHADKHDLDRMQLLLPHIRQAYDLTLRLDQARNRQADLMSMLDCLADGTILIGSDGSVRFANDAARRLLRSGDAIRSTGGRLAFRHPEAQRSFANALTLINAHSEPMSDRHLDFTAKQNSGAQPLSVAVRRLPRHFGNPEEHAIATVFIRDPSAAHPSVDALRTLFSLTKAEAELAEALRNGISTSDYGSMRGLSANTVYTHLRRIKDKTGANRLPDLVRRLNRSIIDLQ